MLLDKLAKIITISPDIIQFAKDRKFEEAWTIPLSGNRPDDTLINEYLKKDKFEVIIVEYVWNSIDDNKRFVLTLFLDKKCKLQDPKEFMEICFGLFYGYSEFAGFIKSLDEKIIGKPYLLQNPVENVNMSIFNHWLTTGPVELWNQGDKYDENLIAQKIKMRPTIEKSPVNYQGLFFRFNINGQLDGPYYGIKTPCCNKKDHIWEVDFVKVDYWMRIMLEL